MQSGEELLIQLTGIFREKALHRLTELNKHGLRGHHPTWNRRERKQLLSLKRYASKRNCIIGKLSESKGGMSAWVMSRVGCSEGFNGKLENGFKNSVQNEEIRMSQIFLIEIED